MRREGTRGREFLIYLFVDVFKKISIFAANNSFGLPKQSLRKKSWSKLIKLLAKFLKSLV